MNEEQIEKQFGYFGDRLETFMKLLYEQNLVKKENEEIEITKDGEELLAKLWPVHEKAEDLILQGFTEEDKKALKIYLEKIRQNCITVMEYKA